ncbi:MAG TPA: hypothetical protein VGH10_03440 [Actinomycetota bacterium]
MNEPSPSEPSPPPSITAIEAATVLVVGATVAGAAYGLSRVRRFWAGVDPTRELRVRVRGARVAYREERDAYRFALFSGFRANLRRVRRVLADRNAELGEAVGALSVLRENLKIVSGKRR